LIKSIINGNNKKETEKTKEILNYLYKDRIKNLNMINFIRGYGIDFYSESGDSILIKGKSDKQWIYISSKSESEYRELFGEFEPEDKYIAVAEDWMLPIIKETKKIQWILRCKRYILPKEINPKPVHHIVKKIKPYEAQYIHSNSLYSKYTSVEYIIDRVKRGIGLGLYDKGGMVAWILTHDDGAIGFLNVLPEFRRHGYGTEITNAIIKEVREHGEIPFVHIEEDNVNSIKLAKKSGFKEDKFVSWLRIENKK